VLSRPHPPILIGGAGEKKTLRLVARYADACNIAVYDPAQAAHKLEVLREHCATEGRDYGEIEKTGQTRFDLGENGENVQRTIESLHEVAEMGFTVAHGSLLGVSKNRQFDLFAERIIPALEKF
jgi:alkanesulfonate monooxygenase SsuD/methylene tetrahydromethanopterin reductase-like flavin-dependent oxidoreductase (luciferase family)